MSTFVVAALFALLASSWSTDVQAGPDDGFSPRSSSLYVTDISTYPYIASVHTPDEDGVATIIHKFYLVTKKGLVVLYENSPTSVTVKYGALDVATGGTSGTAKTIFLHPDVNLALVKVSCPGAPVTYPKLPATGSAPLAASTEVKVLRWGTDLTKLEEITTTIADSSFCDAQQSGEYDAATQYCTEVLNLGVGDVGVPLVSSGRLVGVVSSLSFGTGSEEFFDMAKFRAWVETTTGATFAI